MYNYLSGLGNIREALIVAWIMAMDIELHRGRKWILGLVTLLAFASLAMLAIPSSWVWAWILPLVGSAVLIRLPQSKKWAAESAEAENNERNSVSQRFFRLIYRVALAMPLVMFSLFAFIILPDIPGSRKYDRLKDYPNKEALLAAEPEEVSKIVDFRQDGTNYTAVVLSCMRFLASGPAVFIYNEDGIRIDQCYDSGDCDRFCKRWGAASW